MIVKKNICLTIYQLKAILLGVSRMIWRRLLVRSDGTIADLHHILQIAMGWTDTHLQRFRIHANGVPAPSIRTIYFVPLPR